MVLKSTIEKYCSLVYFFRMSNRLFTNKQVSNDVY